MKMLRIAGAALCAAALAGGPARAQDQVSPAAPGATQPAQPGLKWPRVLQQGEETLTIYQPQIEKWDGAQMAFRAAVSIQAGESGKPVYGVVWMSATGEVDKAARVVTLRDFAVDRISFPTATEKEAQYLDVFRSLMPNGVKTMALDHLEASLAISEAVRKQMELQVANAVPRIFYATSPTILVLVDGQPVLRPVAGLPAERVLNTRSLIARVGGAYYLAAMGTWYRAPAIEGPWTPDANPPAVLGPVQEQAVEAKMVDPMQPEEGAEPPETPPYVLVSTTPAELIQTDGTPQFVPIEGTELFQAQNSDDPIFLYLNANRYYVLLSGRWFAGESLNGPWSFVSAKELPADFAKIPPEHSRGEVLTSVAGTPEAEEALIANTIPQTAVVNRGAAAPDVAYDGAPRFGPIEGTTLSYAVNCPVPVIAVSPGGFYCVQNGVWFVAADPMGPWAVATAVPQAIYGIPITSPMHYVTYVYVYGSTPDEVFCGYTPGYLGVCSSTDGVVVYGTGYWYPSYCGNVWVGYPWSYGFHAAFACDLNVGFAFGFAPGIYPGTRPRPWWGPFGWAGRHGYDYNHVNLNHVNVYHGWDQKVVTRRHNYAENQWQDNRWTGARAPFNPYAPRWKAAEGTWGRKAVTPRARPVGREAESPAAGRGRPEVEAGRRAPAGEAERRAPAEAERRAPPAEVRREAPPAEMQHRAPAAEGERRGPAETERRAPPAEVRREAPPAEMQHRAPSPEAGRTAPAEAPRRAPAAGRETPPAETERRAPVVGVAPRAPAEAAREARPAPAERRAPAAEAKRRAPAAEAAPEPNTVFAGKQGEVFRRAPEGGWQQYTPSGWQNASRDQAFQQKEAPTLNRESEARSVGESRVTNLQGRGGLSPSREAPSREAPSREAPSRETPTRAAPSRETPSREAPSHDAPSRDQPSRDQPSGESPAPRGGSGPSGGGTQRGDRGR